MAETQPSDSHPTGRQVGQGCLRRPPDLIPAGQKGIILRLFRD